MRSRVEIKEHSKAVFRKYPIIFICAGVISLIVSGLVGYLTQAGETIDNSFFVMIGFSGSFLAFFWEVLTGLGFAKFYLSAFDGEEPQFSDIFSYAADFIDPLRLYALMYIKVFAWTLLFIIPGIVAAYNYAQAPYIFMQNPNMKAGDAIDQSIRLMNGRKWDLFVLHLSFLGWYILSVITFGLAYIYVIPYGELAFAGFYRSVIEEEEIQAVQAKYAPTPTPTPTSSATDAPVSQPIEPADHATTEPSDNEESAS